MQELIKSIALVFVSGLLGYLFAIWRERRRDKEFKATAFISFLEGWKQEIIGYPTEPNSFDDCYLAKLPSFKSACASAGISHSKPNVVRVAGFRMDTYSISQQQVAQHRKALLGAIDELVRSTK